MTNQPIPFYLVLVILTFIFGLLVLAVNKLMVNNTNQYVVLLYSYLPTIAFYLVTLAYVIYVFCVLIWFWQSQKFALGSVMLPAHVDYVQVLPRLMKSQGVMVSSLKPFMWGPMLTDLTLSNTVHGDTPTTSVPNVVSISALQLNTRLMVSLSPAVDSFMSAVNQPNLLAAGPRQTHPGCTAVEPILELVHNVMRRDMDRMQPALDRNRSIGILVNSTANWIHWEQDMTLTPLEARAFVCQDVEVYSRFNRFNRYYRTCLELHARMAREEVASALSVPGLAVRQQLLDLSAGSLRLQNQDLEGFVGYDPTKRVPYVFAGLDLSDKLLLYEVVEAHREDAVEGLNPLDRTLLLGDKVNTVSLLDLHKTTVILQDPVYNRITGLILEYVAGSSPVVGEVPSHRRKL
jgi:hypothetical protein